MCNMRKSNLRLWDVRIQDVWFLRCKIGNIKMGGKNAEKSMYRKERKQNGKLVVVVDDAKYLNKLALQM